MNINNLKNYIPKGSMCVNCENYNLKDCYKLKFDEMEIISNYTINNKLVHIVKCTNFKKERH